MLRSLKAGESLTPDTNSHCFEFEISFPDASIAKIEGQQPNDGEGPELSKDGGKESSSLTN